VRIPHGGELVHNDDGGGGAARAGDEAVECLLDESLSSVQRAGGLVEQQDGWLLEQNAGDGDALVLAARELHAALSI
jgi:hypothetical protein